jgi:hypothetical protein
MRELFKYVSITVGFRYGLYAAGFSLLAALLLFAFKYDPMGQFRLLLGIVTIVVMVLAMREYKYIYNHGNMNVTHGFMVSLSVGLFSAFLYALVLFIWISFSDKLWALHINDQLRTLALGKATIVKNYNEGQVQMLEDSIRNASKSYLAVFTFVFRFLWSILVGFMISIYYRN